MFVPVGKASTLLRLFHGINQSREDRSTNRANDTSYYVSNTLGDLDLRCA